MSFHPASTGDRSGTLEIASQSGASVTVVLDGTGVISNLQASPSAIALGNVDVGTSATATVTIANTGTGPGAFGTPAISGAGWSVGSSSCGSAVAAGSNCGVEVVFTPAVLGAPTAALALILDGSAATIPLTAAGTSEVTVVFAGNGSGTITSTPDGISCAGTCTAQFSSALSLTATPGSGSTFATMSLGTCTNDTCALAASTSPRTVVVTFVQETQLYVSPSTLDFGTLAVGSNRIATIDVINDSTTTVPFSVVLTGSDYTSDAAFCGSALGSGAECTVRVAFAPTKLGPEPGSLDFIVNGAHHTSTFTAQGGSFLTVAVVGDPASSVTSAAPGLTTCSGVCAAVVPGDVTFTAHAGSGATFVGWAPGTCGASPTCTVAGVAAPQVIRAKFQSAASTPPIHIEPSQDLGAVPAQQRRYLQTFTIVNDTNASVPLDQVFFDKTYWSVDAGVGSCTTTLAANATCTVVGLLDAHDIGNGANTNFVVQSGNTTISTALGAIAEFPIVAFVAGRGRVAGSFGLLCPGFCEELVLFSGDTFTATPDPSFAIQKWLLNFTTADCGGAPSQCSLVPDDVGGASVDVYFVPQ